MGEDKEDEVQAQRKIYPGVFVVNRPTVVLFRLTTPGTHEDHQPQYVLLSREVMRTDWQTCQQQSSSLSPPRVNDEDCS